MLKFLPNIEVNKTTADSKLLSTLKARIAELYKQKTGNKNITISAIMKGEVLSLDVSVGSKKNSLGRFRNTITAKNFIGTIDEKEFTTKERFSAHRSAMSSIMKTVMKEFPSLFFKSRSKE